MLILMSVASSCPYWNRCSCIILRGTISPFLHWGPAVHIPIVWMSYNGVVLCIPFFRKYSNEDMFIHYSFRAAVLVRTVQISTFWDLREPGKFLFFQSVKSTFIIDFESVFYVCKVLKLFQCFLQLWIFHNCSYNTNYDLFMRNLT